MNHVSAPLEVRERLAIPESRLPDTCRDLTAYPGIEEALVISTCNRVEIYAASSLEPAKAFSELKQFLTTVHEYRDPLTDEIYTLNEPQSLHHLFRVACGLDSMVLGETEILGQLKQAYNLALQHGHTGARLNKAFQRAFNVAKHVRTETNIQRGSVSVASVAVELAEKIFSSLADHVVMVIGAGDTSEKTARALLSVGALAVVYGIASEIGRGRLPDRIWLGTHYVENVQLLPPYPSLAEETTFLLESGILTSSIAVSAGRVLLGFLLGGAFGILLGIATGRATRAEYLADPWVTFFRFTPALALLPLFVLWFGYGEGSKVLLIATSVAVVTILGAHQGVRSVPRVYLDAAAALGASPGLAFRKIVLPAALPHIFASLRIGLGLAWVTIVVAELIDARMPSLGYLLTLAGAYPRVPTMVVGIATIGALVLAFDLLALWVHARATRWMRRTA